MFCRHCGNELQSNDSKFCSSCGVANENMVHKELIHWVPIWLYGLGYLLFTFAILDVVLNSMFNGNNPLDIIFLFDEINLLSYIAGVVWAMAFVSTFQFTPAERKVLRGFSFGLNAWGVLTVLGLLF